MRVLKEFLTVHIKFLDYIFQILEKKLAQVPPYLSSESLIQTLPKKGLLQVNWHQISHYEPQKWHLQSIHKSHEPLEKSLAPFSIAYLSILLIGEYEDPASHEGSHQFHKL